MNYEIEGNGDVLLFIHGLSDNLMYWEPLVADLKKLYKVIRVDLRGHGESELGSEEISIGTYADDLKNLLDKLDIKNINLVGFSLGGAVALKFTIKYPQFVDSLILMSTFFKSDEYLINLFNNFKNSLNMGFEEFFDFMLPLVLCPDVIEKHNDELNFLKHLNSESANIEGYVKAVDACLNFNVENDLEDINVFTLIVAGQYDEIFPLDIQKELHSKIKNSKLIVIKNTKHNLLVGKNNEKIIDIIKKVMNKQIILL